MSTRRDPVASSPPTQIARRSRLRGRGVTVQGRPTALAPAEVARRFVAARLGAAPLRDFPGALPADLAAGYRIQEAAIGLWPDRVAGWKVGRIPAELQAELQADRVLGPVFARNVWRAGPEPTPVSAIAGGFAAVEAEYIYRMGEDATPGRTDWTPKAALDLVEDELVGVEFAASPLASINLLGPRVVAADFGNNAGLILGRSIPDWRERTDDWPPCAAYVEDRLVGRGAPSSIPGGPAASLAFLMNAVAARGRPLKRGQLVTTGAASGIHDIEVDQSARIVFDGLDEIRCIARPAQAQGGSPHDHRDRSG